MFMAEVKSQMGVESRQCPAIDGMMVATGRHVVASSETCATAHRQMKAMLQLQRRVIHLAGKSLRYCSRIDILIILVPRLYTMMTM